LGGSRRAPISGGHGRTRNDRFSGARVGVCGPHQHDARGEVVAHLVVDFGARVALAPNLDHPVPESL
jgi:hypothetical protein